MADRLEDLVEFNERGDGSVTIDPIGTYASRRGNPPINLPTEAQRVATARRKLWDDTRCKSPMHCGECNTGSTCEREHLHIYNSSTFHASGNHKWTDSGIVEHI